MRRHVTNGGSQHLGERTLRQGMKGHDVRVLQGYLTLAGYPTAVDGDFGPATKANVIKFESANGLNANGVVTYAESQVAAPGRRQGDRPAARSARRRSTPTAPPPRPRARPRPSRQVIAAANQIIDKPYIYGGGHAQLERLRL